MGAPPSLRIGILVDRVRVEEKLLIRELEGRPSVSTQIVYPRDLVLDPDDPGPWRFDAVLDRCLSRSRALAVLAFLERFGVPAVNRLQVARTCGDKVATSLALARFGVPQPRLRVAVDPVAGLQAVEAIGYPAVIKPPVGSWGRLVSRVADRDAAEAVLEHKAGLGVSHRVIYAQEHVDKPGRALSRAACA